MSAYAANAQELLLLKQIEEARWHTDRLFDLIRPDSLYQRPIAERHRIVFYIGHLEAFDWNLLLPELRGLKPFDAALDRLFAFGIDPVDGGLPSDHPADWPEIEEVRRYAGRVRQELDSAIAEAPRLLLNVALEHRLMHAETLAYMLHQLPLERKRPQPQPPVPLSAPPRFEMIEVPAGQAILGLAEGFGWDNEFKAHSVDVPAFAIDRYKVTNGQYLEFMRAGGYQERSLWTPADWEWKAEQGIDHPVFWKRTGGEWHHRSMFEEIPLPLDWPVYVSHAESDAYARWAGKRLPSEPEWHRAAHGSKSESPWGDFARWDPAPVNAFPGSGSAFGVEGLLANGWEWTSSVFAPFPGFETFPFYPGYSANFFDGRHYVLKGGSTRTGASMLRRSFRNWFQPHYQYVYAGFRCAC